MSFARHGRRFRFAALLAGAWLVAAGLAFQPQQAPAQPDPQKEARLAWFRDAKYGLSGTVVVVEIDGDKVSR